MRNLMKRASVLVTAAVMLIGSFPQVGGAEEALTPDAYGLYPTAAYTTVSSELDDSRKWKYRELIPDVGCETIAGFWDKEDGTPPSPNTNVALRTDAYRGSYSVSRTMSGYKKLGAKVENLDVYTEKNHAEYLLSMYAKADLAEGLTSVNLTPAYLVNGYKEKSFQYPHKDMQIPINKEWSMYTKTMRISDTDVASIDKSKDMYMYFYAYAKDSLGNTLSNTIYLDEWSLRMAIPTDSPASYVKSISPSPARPIINNGEDLTFKFSLDIDPRTVRKENITVNGTANSPLVKDVKVTTAETTRETTLTISFNTLEEGTAYTVALPEIKDAWGREVIGANTATVYAAEVNEGQYTIFGDLDPSGGWKYRELIPDINCENIKYFADKNLIKSTMPVTNIADADRNVALSTDAYSGNYSLAGDIKGYSGYGTQVDYLEYGAKYIMSFMGKIKPVDHNLTELDTLLPSVKVVGKNADGTEEPKESSLSVKNTIGTEWTRISQKYTMKPQGLTSINPNMPLIVYFQPGAKKVDNVSITSTLYIDDWSMRLALPDDFMKTEVISASGSKDEAVFKFNLDIDPRTVRKNMVAVNGEAESSYVKDVKVTTNEITRETTVTVSLQNLPEKAIHTITLPEIKDAWGREIAGIKSTGLFYEEKITDASGTVVEITNMTAGTRNYVIENIVNNTSKGINMTAIIALYNADKTLESVNLNGVQLAPGQKVEELKASVTIPEFHEGMSVKCFLWNMDTLCPLK